MKVLLYDILQLSDAPAALLTPDLPTTWTGTSTTVTLDAERTFNAVGIGNTDATTVTVAGQAISIPSVSPYPDAWKNGLYLIPAQTTDTVTITHNGTYIGRIAIGTARTLYGSPSRELGFWTTNAPRETLSRQIIKGAGGVSGRQVDMKFTYKFTEDIIADIILAYPDQLSAGYPVFVYFDKESHNIPYPRLYCTIGNEAGDTQVFQNSVRRYLYSKSWTMKEAY